MKAIAPFSRKEMLPALPPPSDQQGIHRWFRENLFSNVLNTVLTCASLGLIFWLIINAMPWWLNSIWSANSRQECRDILLAAGAEDGACWGVIRARWHQYLFGFYPPEQYWRPILSFGLLFVAMAPILFWGRGRQREMLIASVAILTIAAMLLIAVAGSIVLASLVVFACALAIARFCPQFLIWLSALYPFIAIWLLWGGPFWSPVIQVLSIILGIFVARLYWRSHSPALNAFFASIVALCAAYIAGFIVVYADSISGDFFNRLNQQSFWPAIGGESGFLGATLGTILSIFLWACLWMIWALLSVMRCVSWVLSLGLGTVVAFKSAEALNLGAILTLIAVFNAARSHSPVIGILGGILTTGACYIGLGSKAVLALSSIVALNITNVSSDQFGGFLLAFVIGVSAITASLPLGILLALGRQSKLFIIHSLSVAFIEFIRGVPLITLLFSASLLLQYFLPPQTNFDLILRVIILASLFASAYLAEVIRGGLAALARGQYEASDSLGLTYWQAQRLVIMPQALKVSIPGIVSTFIGLFKDTTLVSFVGLLDPLRGVTMSVRADINWKGIYWEPYIFVGALFFVICFSMSRYSSYLERKLKTDHR